MFKEIIIFPIRLYQWFLRPLFPSLCMFHAHGKLSCSAYTIKAIHTQGIFKGVGLGMYRIIRCHPWQRNFDDPALEL